MRFVVLMVVLTASSALAELPGRQPMKIRLMGDEQTLELLRIDHEMQRLEFDRASMIGPSIVLSIGTTGFIVGSVFLVGSFLGSAINGITLLLGLLILGPSALPLAIGIAWMVGNLTHNGRIDEAIRSLEERRGEFEPLGLSQPRMLQLASF